MRPLFRQNPRRFARIALAAILSLGFAPRMLQAEEIKILFRYGSEKKTWIEKVTKTFKDSRSSLLPNGDRIVVDAQAGPSNVLVKEVLEGVSHAHMISPASSIFLNMADGLANERGEKPLVVDSLELVRSPLVIAVWREIAVPMGWPNAAIRWRDVFKLVSDQEAWAAIRPGAAFKSFKFGHTHPEYSNSGLLALIAEVTAGVNKSTPDKLQVADLKTDQLREYVANIEGRVIHYGESTGFFATKMFDPDLGGARFLSAAVLYENLVFEENKKAIDGGAVDPNVVAIYPSDGTFSNEHPVGIVERDWVSAKEREACKVYIEYLRSNFCQLEAKKLGFRPSDRSISVDDVLKPEYGVNAASFNDAQTLNPPTYPVIREALRLWNRSKRAADLVLAIDMSESMLAKVTVPNPEKSGKPLERRKIDLAEEAAIEFIDQLSDNDYLKIILFSDQVDWVDIGKEQMNIEGKEALKIQLKELWRGAGGATALYDAIEKSHDYLDNRPTNRSRGVILLSDGKNTVLKAAAADEKGLVRSARDAKRRDAVVEAVQNDGEKNIFIFPIGYGDPKNQKDLDVVSLKLFAKIAQGKFFPADAATIRKVLREIVTFF